MYSRTGFFEGPHNKDLSILGSLFGQLPLDGSCNGARAKGGPTCATLLELVWLREWCIYIYTYYVHT